MANKIISQTNVLQEYRSSFEANTAICIIGPSSVNGTAVNTVFKLTSTTDAETIFGDTNVAVKMVKAIIQNGGGNIRGICVAETSPDWVGALKTLIYEWDIKYIIPTVDFNKATNVDMYNALVAHLLACEQDSKFRYGIVGIPPTTKVSDVATLGLNDHRILCAGLGVTDEDGVNQPGAVLAAALSAIIESNSSDPALPINSVRIRGFGGVSTDLLSADKDTLITKGIAPVFVEVDGSIQLYQLPTTAFDSETWKDATTLFIADQVLQSVILRIKNNFQRTKNIPRVLDSIRSECIFILDTFQSFEIIENFDPELVTCVRDPEDNFGALLDYTIDVVTPLYTIKITQHLKI
jgi:phage tail sheath gpL-like